jgi:hypothetical protein
MQNGIHNKSLSKLLMTRQTVARRRIWPATAALAVSSLADHTADGQKNVWLSTQPFEPGDEPLSPERIAKIENMVGAWQRISEGSHRRLPAIRRAIAGAATSTGNLAHRGGTRAVRSKQRRQSGVLVSPAAIRGKSL